MSEQVMRILIVDDEPLALSGLRAMLADVQGVEVVGECASGDQALTEVLEKHPDVVLLDIAMPGISGIEVLDRIGADGRPLIVMITAHDEHAIAAFEGDATDYLLKPVSDERLERALHRCRARLRLDQTGGSHSPTAEAPLGDRLELRTLNRIVYADPDDIVWIEAASYCVRVHLLYESVTVRKSMKMMEAALPYPAFCRVHRSSIINMSAVHEVQPDLYGDSVIVLLDGTRIRMSRSRRKHFAGALGRKF